jgi:hypothetical protein
MYTAKGGGPIAQQILSSDVRRRADARKAAQQAYD